MLMHGYNVKLYRLRKNLTQEQLAEKLNISTNYLGRIERGVQIPYFHRQYNLAKSLGVEVYELYLIRDLSKKLPKRVDMAKNSWIFE